MAIVAITGANGFLGRATVRRLAARHEVRPLVRRPAVAKGLDVAPVVVDYSDPASLADAFRSVDAVVHLADDPDRVGGRAETTELETAIAAALRDAGVPRLVYASSVYAGRDASAYSRRKAAIEVFFAGQLGDRAVGVRLVPVYDGSDRGSVGLLRKLVRRGVPLPFGAARAPRQYLAVENAAALFEHLVALANEDWTRVAGRVWIASDGEPLSTRTLIERLAVVEGTSPRLLPVPAPLVISASRLAGKRSMADAAFGALDIPPDRDIRSVTDWRPSVSMTDQLRSAI